MLFQIIQDVFLQRQVVGVSQRFLQQLGRFKHAEITGSSNVNCKYHEKITHQLCTRREISNKHKAGRHQQKSITDSGGMSIMILNHVKQQRSENCECSNKSGITKFSAKH